MSKTSEETFSFPSTASHPTHIYNSLHCSPNKKINEQTAIDTRVDDHQILRIVDGFHSPFNNNLMCREPLKISQNHDGVSSINSNHRSQRPLETEPKNVSFKTSALNNFDKNFSQESVIDHKYSILNDSCEVDSNGNDDSMSAVAYVIPEQPSCNGAISRSNSNSTLPSPMSKPDSSNDMNGCLKSLILPIHEADRTKMNLDKLDETIDYVLSVARSDELCENMFVLSCRMREPSHISSPNIQSNTPSSGLVTSPTLSPAPSPHSNQINTSPIVVQTPKPQSVFQSNNLCNIISPQPMQRYIVDPTHGILHLSNASSQCAPTQYSNQTVSFLQICSDSPSNSVIQCTQHHLVSQIAQPLNSSAAHVVFHPGVIHSFQNHTGHPTNFAVPQSTISAASVQRIHTPLLSPVKANVCNQTFKTIPSSDGSISTHTSLHLTATTQQKLSTALSLSQSNICVVRNPVQSSQSLVYGTINNGCIHDGKQTLSSPSANDDKKHILTTFRQPIVPVQSSPCPTSMVHGINMHQSNGSIFQHDQSPVPYQNSGSSKKRCNNTVTVNSKRRKISTLASNTPTTNMSILKNVSDPHITPNRVSHSVAQHCFEKLKNVDVKSLVSAPHLQQYTSVLPPPILSDLRSFLGMEDEEAFIRQKGLKYSRGALSMCLPMCLSSCNIDNYLIQHLETNIPSGPMIRSKSYNVPVPSNVSVRASPEPLSFENNMVALFSKIHQFTKKESNEDCHSECSFDSFKLTVDASVPNSLLNVFSQSPPCSIGKLDVDRCTPPLPLHHIPNPRLLCQPIQPTESEKKLETKPFSEDNAFSSTIKPEPSAQNPDNPSVNRLYLNSEICNGSSGSSPLIDSETGEVLLCRNSNSPHLSQNSEFSLTENEKLHITFTINPSTTVSIPKIIRRITDLLGIEKDSVGCEITRSGAQITLDQKQHQNEVVMRSLETHLRQQFTPLSLHFKKESTHQSNLEFHGANGLCASSNTESSLTNINALHVSHLNKVENNFSSKLENSHLPESEVHRYPEEPVSLISLLANKHHIVNKVCRNCDKSVPPYLAQRKWLEELANVTGVSMRSDNAMDFVFCSNDCLMSYSRFFSNRSKYSDLSTDYMTQALEFRTNNIEAHRQLIVCDLPCSVPVLLQNCPSKTKSINLKRQCSSQSLGIASKRRATNTSMSSSKYKKWRGVRWRSYSVDSNQHFRLPKRSTEEIFSHVVHGDPRLMKISCSKDYRMCVLCSLNGDALADGAGRLLPLDLDRWVHINCALWCYEVYETVGGSLNNIDLWLDKAMETICSHCGNTGAGLPCYNPKCAFAYHVPCAIELGCIFFTDRGMYCPQHQPREIHPMQLSSLAVIRRVYINRDENSQVAQVVHEEDRSHVVRVGGVCLHAIGQLLPHQIESGYFHTRRNIYPVGLCTTRIYWSMRIPLHRAKYICKIFEQNGRPLFKVTAVDKDIDNEVLTHETCDGVWQIILSRIEVLRKEHKLVRIFPQHLKGEDLYGLGEPHIVRTIESLPGVDGLRDYVFNFGRLELISEMPLAINPSGCARSEPKMQTYVKRFRSDSTDCATPNPRSISFLGIRRLSYPGVFVNGHSLTDVSVSKQHQNSRSQQYRRLKAEVNINVILGRSRIQGLGLFAARDLEDQTLVIEYIGELIRSELANKREKDYEAHNKGIYMFRLDDDTVIDATVCGGLARYINHSCQPNCYAECVNFVDQSHIVIITNRRIKKGEELCYDYNFDMDDRGDKIPCFCGASNCRKWMN